MRMICLSCQGTGIGAGMRARFGELMNRCERCEGHGVITDEPGPRDFVAIFPVSDRYVVHVTIPRQREGTIPVHATWSPRVPPKRGRGALKQAEQAAYERGRNAAIAAFRAQMGLGEIPLIAAKELH